MIDLGLNQYFGGSGDEMYYGKVRVETAAFQDDIAKPSGDVRTAQSGMVRLEAMLSERGLEAHSEKTGYLVFGCKKFKEEVEKEVELRPLMFGKFEVARKQSDKYLGQVLHEGGLARSVQATIEERTGKIKGAIYTTASILNTIQMQAMGGLMAAKYLWEGAIVPSLLSGAGTWVGCTPMEEAMCEELQELYWRTVLQVPKGTPKVMLRAETGSLKMKFRIWKEKVRIVERIRNQERSLAKAIHEEQLAMGWPGLAKEVKEICKVIGVEDVNVNHVKKEELDEAILYANQKDLKEDIERYEKLKDVKGEDYRKEQEYMMWKGVDKSRMAFRLRTRMLNKVKMNYKNMHRGNLKCEECELDEEETQEHMVVCPGWAMELGTLDVTRMDDMVEFFTRVMRRKQ